MKVLYVATFAAATAITTTIQAKDLRGSSQFVDTRRLDLMNAMTGSAPTRCQIEHGFDYVGNDYDNKPSPTADGCCSICANSAACNAFTWSAHNGGTCWLKTTRGEIVVNPNTKSAVFGLGDANYVCPGGTVGLDFVGNDIANAPSANFAGCCAKCLSTLGCRAYSWTNYNGGTCWLKSGADKFERNAGVTSTDLYPALQERCNLIQDVDFRGNDIGSVPAAAASECCVKCGLKTGCKAFTWTSHNGGTCWLKSTQGPCDRSTQVAMPGAVSCTAMRECDVL